MDEKDHRITAPHVGIGRRIGELPECGHWGRSNTVEERVEPENHSETVDITYNPFILPQIFLGSI
jgi:hypothetical protein